MGSEDGDDEDEHEVALPGEIHEDELFLVRDVALACDNGAACVWSADVNAFPRGVRPLLRRWLNPENYKDDDIFVNGEAASEQQCIKLDHSCVEEAVAEGNPLLLCIRGIGGV